MKVILNTIRMEKKWRVRRKKVCREVHSQSIFSSKQVQYTMRLQNAKVHRPVIPPDEKQAFRIPSKTCSKLEINSDANSDADSENSEYNYSIPINFRNSQILDNK